MGLTLASVISNSEFSPIRSLPPPTRVISQRDLANVLTISFSLIGILGIAFLNRQYHPAVLEHVQAGGDFPIPFAHKQKR